MAGPIAEQIDLQRAHEKARAGRLAYGTTKYPSRREGIVGSIAFSRSGDLSSGAFEDAQVLRKFGEAPVDLSEL